MPLKCCVTGCSSNYDRQDAKKVSVFRLPKSETERARRIDSVPSRETIPRSASTRSFAGEFLYVQTFVLPNNYLLREGPSNL